MGLLRAALLVMVVIGWAAEGRAGVTVEDKGDLYVLSNGVTTAAVRKSDGGLASLKYRGVEFLASVSGEEDGRAYAYWSHSAATQGGARTTARVTIDPKSNGGERGEVAVKGISNGERMGGGPGGSVVADIEIRYAMEKGTNGVYTYSEWTHPAKYPWTSVGEARFCAKLNDDVFDWMTVDAKRNMKMLTTHDWNYGTPLNMKEVRLINTGEWKGRVEHKYDYSANQFDVRAWGWSSTTKHVGVWFVNPSVEYLSGGPTKIELSAHRDATFKPEAKDAPAPPCLLNYWRGSHYGGSSAVIAGGESWKKVIGPFLIYCNGGKESRTPEGLWQEALAKEKEEEAKWPYGWVNGVDYPHAAERGAAEGQIVLDDRQGGGGAGGGRLEHLRVGLTHADYVTAARPASAGGQGGAGGVGRQGGAGGGGRPGGAGRFNAGPQNVTWQNDAKFYEFWVRGDEAGHFSIPAVRAGRYTLHAIADNVLGEFAEADVTVEAGKTVELGKVVWKPVRFGQQVWEIGKPDRTADEFKNGDIYNSWGLYNKYAEEFPNDVTFVIGKSDPKTDWNLMEVPHRVGTTGYQGRETTWTVVFEMDHVPTGGATLRLAFAGTEARSLSVGVNGKEAGQVTGLMNTSVIHRDADRSYWQERDVKFPGTMLQKGTNRITLTVPAGSTTAGVEYDYLRLEVEG